MLVEQIRMGPLVRGDRVLWHLEPVAGHVDPGETPEDAARREMREETGRDLIALEPVAESYPSAGASSEFYHVFVGIADLPDDSAGQTGLESEGEHIRTHLIGFDAMIDLLDSGKASVAPRVMAGYWLARHRDRIRAAART